MQTNQTIHPRSLSVFFTTEMWERYGFYTVQTLLALFLVLHHKWNDSRVYLLVGSFTALTYLSPVIGGWIADHLLGQKRAVLLGATILLLSYFILGLDSEGQILIACLSSIAVGTGLLKPNITSLLGNAYPPESPDREKGFTIFYMGITLGIILGTTFPGYIKEHFGWPYAFLSAAAGLVIALVLFSYGIIRHDIEDYTRFEYQFKKIIKAFVLLIVLWTGCFYILSSPALASLVFWLVLVFSILYMVITIRQQKAMQARKTLIIGLLCIISVLFWTFYFQMFLSLTLFIERLAQPQFLGIVFPAPYYVAVQSIGMIIFGVFFVKRKAPPHGDSAIIQIGNKFLLAMFFMSLSYSLILLITKLSFSENLLSPLFFIPAYLLISIAELLLSPVGLSAITILASPKKVSTMMGIFFVSLGMGGFLSGKLANITALPPYAHFGILELKQYYEISFNILLCILLAATVICIFINRAIKYLSCTQS